MAVTATTVKEEKKPRRKLTIDEIRRLRRMIFEEANRQCPRGMPKKERLQCLSKAIREGWAKHLGSKSEE